MISQEEIRVAVGVDSSQVQPGLGRVEAYIDKFGSKMVTKFNKLLVTNVFHMLLSEISPELERFKFWKLEFWQNHWNAIYGADAKSVKAAEETHQRIRALRKEVADFGADRAKAEAAMRWEEATPEGKVEIARWEYAQQDQAMQELRGQIDTTRRLIDALKQQADQFWISTEERQPLKQRISEYWLILAELEAKENKVAKERLDAARKLEKAEEAITKQRTNQAEATQRELAARIKLAQAAANAVGAQRLAEQQPLYWTLDELAGMEAPFLGSRRSGPGGRRRGLFGRRPWQAEQASEITRLLQEAKYDVLSDEGAAFQKADRARGLLRNLREKWPFVQDPMQDLVANTERAAKALERGVPVVAAE